MRLKEPGDSVLNTVGKKNVKEAEKDVFKLKLKGP